MPGDYFEMRNKAMEIEDVFKKLPRDLKAVFDNDVNKFIANLDNPDVLAVLQGKKIEKKVEEKKVEEKVDEK